MPLMKKKKMTALFLNGIGRLNKSGLKNQEHTRKII